MSGRCALRYSRASLVVVAVNAGFVVSWRNKKVIEVL
jgi:hypothetical protein